jgi:glycosyltransferase involved in cell wall biosynthesis
MNGNPTVSVIVPTYNREKSILETLQSIEAQSFRDFEIVIIDDGSTDGTREIVYTLQSSKISYYHQKNQGLPAAWNTGIQRSRGKYVAFLDSDDQWFINKLEHQVAYLEGAGQNHSGCVTGYFLRTVNQKKIPIIPSLHQANLKQILWKNILHLGTTFMCHRNIFREVGYFDENLRRGQDTDWLLRYCQLFQIGIIPEILAVFNQHLERSAEIMEKSSLYFLEKHRSKILEQGHVFYRRKTASIFRDLAYQFSRENNQMKASEYSKKSISTYPLPSPGIWLILADGYLGTQWKRKIDSFRYPGVFK